MIFLRIPAKSISTYTLENDIPSYPSQHNFYVYTRQWYSFVSRPNQFLRLHSKMIFLRIPAKSISTYTLDNDIPSYPCQFNFCVYTRQWYSFVSRPNQFLRIHSTMIFLRIPAKSISTYTLDNDIPSYPSQHNFYVYTRQWYSIVSRPNQFLRIHSKMIFLRILAKSISTYTLDNDIPSYPSQFNFCVYTRQWYSFVSRPNQFLRIHSTMIFLRIPAKSISTYTLENGIPSYPGQINFYVYTRQWYSFVPRPNQFLRIHSTMIFLRIQAKSISTYTLDNDIPSYPGQINFYVYTRQWYSFVSQPNQFLSIHSTMIFLRTPAKSISTYTLDDDIPSYPSQINF